MAAVVNGAAAVSADLDFDRARKVYKRWKEIAYANGLKRDTEVLLVVENGEFGVWFPPVKAAKQPAGSDAVYAFDGEFIKAGTTTEVRLRGKWCVPEKKFERIWNFISNPWELLVPNRLETLVLGQGDQQQGCLSFPQALTVMDTNAVRSSPADGQLNKHELADKAYQRHLNLGDEREGSVEWVEQDSAYRRAIHGETGCRLFVPLILKCGRMQVHLPSVG